MTTVPTTDSGSDFEFPAKRQKLDPGCSSSREANHAFQPSHLNIVPVEILAEILYYVTSPNDILSVARCNKRLCATLLNPSNVMIWRRARRNCVVPGLLPPPQGWSESAYAAFIFDAGSCHVCDVPSKRMILSFVARLRLCPKHDCRKIFFTKYVATQPHASTTKSKEFFFEQRLGRLDVPPLPGSVPTWPSDPTYYYCLHTDLKKVMTEYEEMIASGIPQDEYLRLREADTQLKRQVFKHAVLLFGWRQKWIGKYRTTKASNKAFAQNLASEAGWSLHDLLNNPTYISLHRSHNLCLETIQESLVRSLMTRIDSEILSQMENKERRQKIHAEQIRRSDIGRHYDRLFVGQNYPVVPTLAQFQGLPIIKALHDREDTTFFAPDSTRTSSSRPVKTPRILNSELKRSQLLGGMIDSDLKTWVDTALRQFDAILGQPNWKRASTKLLHPSERVDARFLCPQCQSTSKKSATPESLDFRGVCAHECSGLHRKAAAKKRWRVDQFIPDRKAIDALSRALALAELKAESRETEDKVNSIGARFVCRSCDPPTVMDFWRLVGHCRRHDTMQLALASTTEAVALMAEYPYRAGSFELYTDSTDASDKMRQTKTFGCRHCQHKIVKSNKRAHYSQNASDLMQRRFTFDGLVSHAKEKHGIYPMGEEDFYRDIRTIADGKEMTKDTVATIT